MARWREIYILYPLAIAVVDQILYIKNGKSIVKYSLVSIIHHFGNLYNGHYTSSVKINKNWYYIDDCSIIKSENKLNHSIQV